MGAEQKLAQYLARFSQGSLGWACQLAKLEQAGAGIYETARKIIESVAGFRYADSVDLAERFLANAREIAAVWEKLDEKTSKSDLNRRVQKLLIQMIISGLSDAMKLNIYASNPLINADNSQTIKQIAARFDAEQAAEKISNCYKSLRWIDSSVNEKLIFEDLLLNLAGSDTIKA